MVQDSTIKKIHYVMIGLAAAGIFFVTAGLYLSDEFFWNLADAYFYALFIAVMVASYVTIRHHSAKNH